MTPTFSHEQRSIMSEKLIQATKDFAYRYKRYGIKFSIAIGHTSDEVDLPPLSQHIRESDRFIVLDHNTCAIVLDCANDVCGIKAANNLLTLFQGTYFSATIFTSIVTVSNYTTPELMFKDLFYLLNYAIEHNMNAILVEHSCVIS
jgi:hypothetical protein